MTHESTLPETKGPHGWSREKGYYPLETAGDAQGTDPAVGATASGATPAQLAELSDRYGANNVTENPDGSVTVSKTFSAAAVQEMFTHEGDEPPADEAVPPTSGDPSDVQSEIPTGAEHDAAVARGDVAVVADPAQAEPAQ